MAKARYYLLLGYDEEFRKELDKFKRHIKVDESFSEIKQKKKEKIVSEAIRALIRGYNQKRTREISNEKKV